MDAFSRNFGMPTNIIINFFIFQYLLAMYYSRRKQWRVMSLLLSAAVGFLSIMPFANKDERIVYRLNDISETASILTFLIQVTILGYDVLRRVKMNSLRVLVYISDMLTAICWILIIINLLEIGPLRGHGIVFIYEMDNIIEFICLFFIFSFRFYYLSLARDGFKELLTNRKMEIFLYLLFFAHEYPFLIIEAATGESWEFVQALAMRVTIAMCLTITIKGKLRASPYTNKILSGGSGIQNNSEGGIVAKSADSAMNSNFDEIGQAN